uniref:Uncharacterized protein n=1 Tax=viral metagenome TaxID=1070528 RepID=A0A6C0CIZ9_9ZZZZ
MPTYPLNPVGLAGINRYNELRWKNGKMVHTTITETQFHNYTFNNKMCGTIQNIDIFHYGNICSKINSDYYGHPSLHLSESIQKLTNTELRHFAKYMGADLVHFSDIRNRYYFSDFS